MNGESITSLQNPLVKCWRALNKSRAERVAHGLSGHMLALGQK